MAHPDSELIRRLLVGRVGSVESDALTEAADDQAGDVTDVPRVIRTCLKTGPHAGTTAPAAPQCPPIAAGASLFISNHAQENSRG